MDQNYNQLDTVYHKGCQEGEREREREEVEGERLTEKEIGRWSFGGREVGEREGDMYKFTTRYQPVGHPK